MEGPHAPAVTLSAEQLRLNLRELQEEALQSLYAGTSLAGLALLALAVQLPRTWAPLLAGFPLLLLPWPVHRLLQGSYLGRAWLLVGLWLGGTGILAAWLPAGPAPALLALPVALAALLISPGAGALTGLAVSLGVLAATLAGPLPLAVGAIAMGLAWGLLGMVWLALRPLHAALGWSWGRYELARQQVEQARDVQADLKQTVKDLAEASQQMARLNQLLGAARRAAEEAERAKAEFVANVSHELRTPLNMILGFSEMILGSPRPRGRVPPALQADLAVIQRNSQHLAELIDDVLDLSQIEAGRMALTKERAALPEIVSAASEAIRPLFDSKGLALTSEVAADLTLLCDPTRIREVLLNLLSNAGRFTERGGVHVTAQARGAEVVVSVSDTGPGIPLEEQARLFRPFTQVDGSLRRRHGGSGLGLAISRHFVELHGGRIWLESQVGRGTTIYFSLPTGWPERAEGTYRRWLNPEWEYRQRTRRSLVPPLTLRPRLIVVEKGTLLQRLLRRYLRQTEITAVGSLEQAAQELARTPAQALLINDPALGPALERVRQAGLLPYGTPAVICALPEAREATAGLGVDDYLVKPVRREDLFAALDRLGIARGTILLVDDEPDAIQLFWRLLAASGRGYRVLTAANGEQALAILQTERPDAMLLDLIMPGMDGFQLLARRGEGPAWRDVPVIVISARDPAGHPIVAQALGITRGGGLSVPQLLSYIETVTGPLAAGEGSGPPAPPAAPPG